MDKKEEILLKHLGEDVMAFNDSNWNLHDVPEDAPMVTITDKLVAAMTEYASIQCAEKDEEIKRLRDALEAYLDRIKSLRKDITGSFLDVTKQACNVLNTKSKQKE